MTNESIRASNLTYRKFDFKKKKEGSKEKQFNTITNTNEDYDDLSIFHTEVVKDAT